MRHSRIHHVLLAIAIGWPAAAGAAPLDLRADARQAAARGTPIVILFSLPDCEYCNEVRQNYLLPLTRGEPEGQRPVVREMNLADAAPIAGFQGESASPRDLARRYGIRVAPTVLLVDPAGSPLAAPIVGGDTAGLYGGYLDNALAEAARKLAEARRINQDKGTP